MRVSKYTAVLGITLAGALLIVLGGLGMRRVRCERLTQAVVADGRFHPVARFTQPLSTASSLMDSLGTDDNAGRVRLAPDDDGSARAFYRAPLTGGPTHLLLHTEQQSWTIPVQAAITWRDSAGDGLPDSLHLHEPDDRLRFRKWFAALADEAASLPDLQLPSEISDCSALLRYSYRLALTRHDDRWYRQFPPGTVPSLPSVQQWTYPDTPLGAALFRVTAPSGTPMLSDFAEFADAKTLYSLNSFRIGRDVRIAKPGDLLFFHQLEGEQQYHSMIVTGEDEKWVVYHTGPSGSDQARNRGEMRRARMEDLLHHPDPRWHPSASNPNFLGVYRWNLLRED